MIIYPAIDIKDGKCVRLKQGDFGEVTVFNNDPSDVAVEWEKYGASFIHVVDLDGARHGSGFNNEVIKKILSRVNVPIQVGGGIRNIQDVDDKINMGVSRVILGTASIKSPDFVKEAVKKYGDRVAVGIDALNSRVAVEGWEEISNISTLKLCSNMKEIGVKTIIYTDITKDGMMSGPNIESTKEIIDVTGLDIIASGGISSIRDLEEVKNIKAKGAIIGKALYNGALRLDEIINLFEKGK